MLLITLMRTALIWLAGIGIAYFARGLYLMGLFISGLPEMRTQLVVFSIPHTLLALSFVAVLILAIKKRTKIALAVLVFAFVGSVGLAWYDISHYRWQMNGGGDGHTYLIWWTYYEPRWQHYKPGTI